MPTDRRQMFSFDCSAHRQKYNFPLDNLHDLANGASETTFACVVTLSTDFDSVTVRPTSTTINRSVCLRRPTNNNSTLQRTLISDRSIWLEWIPNTDSNSNMNDDDVAVLTRTFLRGLSYSGWGWVVLGCLGLCRSDTRIIS